jgi:hypothetical protein
MRLLFSEMVASKLRKRHRVTEREIVECFDSWNRKSLLDVRARHQSIPPTEWFIGRTAAGRELKVVFIKLDQEVFAVKTAFEPNEEERRIYRKFS